MIGWLQCPLNVFFIILLFFCSGCSGDKSCKNLNTDSCPVLKNFTVFQSNQVVNFNHLCSEVNHGYDYSRKSYVFFERSPGQSYKALVLGELAVGWVSIKERGINLQLTNMRIESLWPDSQLALILQMRNLKTNEMIVGNETKLFFYSYKEKHDQQAYTLSNQGNLEWENFKEPEEQRNSPHKSHDFIKIDSSQITHLKDQHSVSLILKNLKTETQLELQGPILQDLESLLDIEKPKPKTLGLLQTLNPFEEGGLFGWLAHGFRYRDCIYTRKQAKKEFARRFFQQ